MSKFVACACIIALSVVAVSPVAAQQKNIVETAASAGNFNTLIAAAKAAGLAGALSGNDQLTVFAPTDDAFAKLDQNLLASLLQPENKDKLAAILTYHVVPGRVSASAAYGLNEATPLQGQRLNLDFRGEKPMVNQAQVVASDIQCSNGVIHVIDEVLLPSLDTIPATAVKAGTFNTLVAAVGAAGLGDVLGGQGPFTVFAPSDDAFAKLPAGTVESLLKPENKQKLVDILKYHVVQGRVYDEAAVKAGKATTLLNRSVKVNFSAEGLMVNDAKVVAKNLDASNGVIHVIDSVLLPGSSVGPAEALTMLSDAINRGAPVFNAGQHQECCNIYTGAMTGLMESGIDGADQHTMSIISNALSNANRTSNDTDRAWALRSGVDQLYNRLGSMQMTTTVQPRN